MRKTLREIAELVDGQVVGDQDIRHLAGHEKSNKHRKAEELIAKGQPIRILAERDFAAIVGMD